MNVRKTAVVLLAATAMPAFAQQPSQLDQEIEALREVCKADIDRLCPPAEGAVLLKDCLKKHAYQVSPGCAQTLKNLGWRK